MVEVGGGLRVYSAAGRDLLDGYAVDEIVHVRPGPGPAPMAEPPRGRKLRVRRAAAPAPADRAGDAQRDPRPRPRARLDGGRARADPGRHGARARAAARLPVLARAQHRVRALGGAGSRVRTTATNVGREACPFGSGAHPYLAVGTATIDTRFSALPGERCCDPTSGAFRWARTRRGHGIRLPSARGRSARRSSTTPSPTSSAGRTASPASSSAIRGTPAGARSGSTRPTRT